VRKSSNGIGDTWEFYSVGDAFENGASFIETKDGYVTKPNYSPGQKFEDANAKSVRSLTRSSSVLQCSKTSICWAQIQSLVGGPGPWVRGCKIFNFKRKNQKNSYDLIIVPAM